MECVIPARYLKLFAKSVSCMAKVGDELFIEATETKLILRTINASRSAFLAFSLNRTFFDTYTLEDNIDRKYQVKLKPCQAVFKQYTNMEKCTMRLDEGEQRLVFEILCKHSIQKVYKLTLEDCEAVQAVYSKNEDLNKITSLPKKLIESTNNFHAQLDEISMLASKEQFKLKSYIDDAKAASKVLQTELAVDASDFEEYVIHNDAVVTFSLKDFKSVLGFCDASGQPVTVYFERAGRPICLSVKYFGVFESDFVLATMLETSHSSGNSSNTTSSSQTSSTSTPSGSHKRKDYDSSAPSPSFSPTHKLSASQSAQFIASKNLDGTPASSVFHSQISPTSSPSVITSGSSGKVSQGGSKGQTAMEVDETFADGDYESEVEGSPEPLTKKAKVDLLAQQAIADIQFVSQSDQQDDSMLQEDDEDVPCSVEE